MSKSMGHTPSLGQEMAQFSRKDIMGVAFDTTERLDLLMSCMAVRTFAELCPLDILNWSLWEWVYRGLSGMTTLELWFDQWLTISSSAKDQISNQTVAVKKLADPFKTDNIAKHMHREVKLLKQLQHENVRLACRYTLS